MVKEKKLGKFSKNYRIFYPKNCHYAFKNMGLGSGILDPGVKKGTGSTSATLITTSRPLFSELSTNVLLSWCQYESHDCLYEQSFSL
jgi:hypothetical protein